MASRCFCGVLLVLAIVTVSAAADHYSIYTAAGGAPIPTPVSALAANIQPYAVAADTAGNVYFSSPSSVGNSTSVYKVDANGVVTRVAGNARRGFSGDGGPAVDAQVTVIQYMAMSSTGDLYLSDSGNSRIRKVNRDGIITTVIGNYSNGLFSGDGGPASAAGLNFPAGLAFDSTGNLYVADGNNHRIRKVSTSGIVQTIAGSGLSGNTGDGGPALDAAIGNLGNSMRGLAADANGAVYLAVDDFVRKISLDGTITTIAGTLQSGTAGDGGLAISAQLRSPNGLAIDGSGNLYIADYSRIRKVSVDGSITTLAGMSATGYFGDGGPAIGAQFGWTYGLARDSAGNLMIADPDNCRLRKVSPDGLIATLVGNGLGVYLGDGGPAIAAQLNSPFFAGIDNQNNLLISDYADNIVRRVSASGEITTIAGDGAKGRAAAVREGQPALQTAIGRPGGVVSDANGNIYIADSDNACVWRVDLEGRIYRFAGNGNQGYSGDGGPAAEAGLVTPSGIALDRAGNLYIADVDDQRVRKVSRDGIISTVAGTGRIGFSGDGGLAVSAVLHGPQSVAVSADGSIYIVDYNNVRIRKISSDGMIHTIVSGVTFGYGGDGIPASTAHIPTPIALALDAEGNLYFSALMVFRISTLGILSIVAGSPAMGYNYDYTGDGGPATQASFGAFALAVAADGRIYFADADNDAVRVLVPERKPGPRRR